MNASRLTMHDGIGWIELHRPSRGNALSAVMVESILENLAECVAATDVHTVSIVGAGRHFCTGFDLEDLDQSSDGDLLQRLVRIETLLDAVWRAPLRTIAIAQGHAIGAGADLWVACDHRVLAPETTIRFPGAGFGIVLGTRRLSVRVGAERALDWVSTGRVVPASLALESGLASAIASESAPLSTPQDTKPAASSIERWRSAALPAPVAVDRMTYAALKTAARDAQGFPTADADLAALVRSASRPGLKHRLIAYRDRNSRR